MLTLRVVQAKYGDCLLLVNETAGQKKYILIDGGPGQVYGPYLKPELQDIAAAGGRLELAVLSHVDNDHVIGMLQFFNDLRKAEEEHTPPVIAVAELWHNGFSKILPPQGLAQAGAGVDTKAEADALENEVATMPLPEPPGTEPEPEPAEGIDEGHQLMLADAALDIPRNVGFPDEKITLEGAPNPLQVGGMKLWVIGPPQKNLDRLGKAWVEWLKAQNLPFAGGAAEAVQPDDSMANLSSIMFLAEAGGRRILLTGDGLGDDIIDGLVHAGLLGADETSHMQMDVFKLPHHASARNAVGKLFDRVWADTYVVSANGKYSNPDLQTLLWLVDATCAQGRQITIWATNQSERTEGLNQLLELRPPETYKYSLHVMKQGARAEDVAYPARKKSARRRKKKAD